MIGIEEQVGLCSTIEQILRHDYNEDYEISIKVTNFDTEVWNVVMSLPGGGDYYREEFDRTYVGSLWDFHDHITMWCINNLDKD
tara:strand:+ start:296 stop:547 length:252 start_codon:yes stop_codon:yes gene_type:complete